MLVYKAYSLYSKNMTLADSICGVGARGLRASVEVPQIEPRIADVTLTNEVVRGNELGAAVRRRADQQELVVAREFRDGLLPHDLELVDRLARAEVVPRVDVQRRHVRTIVVRHVVELVPPRVRDVATHDVGKVVGRHVREGHHVDDRQVPPELWIVRGRGLWRRVEVGSECKELLAQYSKYPEKQRFPLLPAYEQVLKCSHLFNLLDARGAISVTERVGVIKRVRDLAVGTAKLWADQQSLREEATA